jgi:hypothetical protein
MIGEFTRLARPYFVMLAIVTLGRWAQGTVYRVPYEQGTHVFSIVTLTLFASLFSAVYLRSCLGWRLSRAVGFAVFFAVVSQLVILASTAAAYMTGVTSYFNHPTALNRSEPVGLGQALGIRVFGLVVNAFLNGIAGALGWALGALLPRHSPRQ